MGEAVTDKTKDILDAYLALGVLETESNKDNPEFLSQQYILDLIGEGEIPNNYVRRKFLDAIENWLPIDKPIKTGSQGSKLNTEIPTSNYNDFISILLILTLIEDKGHISILGDLAHRGEGEKLLSLITKLVIAKRKQIFLRIKLSETAPEIRFKPKHFSYNNNRWWVSGKDYDGERTFELSQIYSSELPENQMI